MVSVNRIIGRELDRGFGNGMGLVVSRRLGHLVLSSDCIFGQFFTVRIIRTLNRVVIECKEMCTHNKYNLKHRSYFPYKVLNLLFQASILQPSNLQLP